MTQSDKRALFVRARTPPHTPRGCHEGTAGVGGVSLHRHWLSWAFKHVDLDRERARVELAPTTALPSDRYRRGMPGPGDRRGVDPLREQARPSVRLGLRPTTSIPDCQSTDTLRAATLGYRTPQGPHAESRRARSAPSTIPSPVRSSMHTSPHTPQLERMRARSAPSTIPSPLKSPSHADARGSVPEYKTYVPAPQSPATGRRIVTAHECLSPTATPCAATIWASLS